MKNSQGEREILTAKKNPRSKITILMAKEKVSQ